MKRTVAEIVRFAAIVGEVIHRTVRRNVFGVLGYELCKKPKKKAVRETNDGWEERVRPTVDQSVWIVRENSYIVIVNPEK